MYIHIKRSKIDIEKIYIFNLIIINHNKIIIKSIIICYWVSQK